MSDSDYNEIQDYANDSAADHTPEAVAAAAAHAKAMDEFDARYRYNQYGYQHGERVLVPSSFNGYSPEGYEVAYVDEVLDDTIVVRYEGTDEVFSIGYNEVVRPAKSLSELID